MVLVDAGMLSSRIFKDLKWEVMALGSTMSNPAAVLDAQPGSLATSIAKITLPPRKKIGDGGNNVFPGSSGYMPHLFAIWVCLKNWVSHHFPHWNALKWGNPPFSDTPPMNSHHIISPYIAAYPILSQPLYSPVISFHGQASQTIIFPYFSNVSCLKTYDFSWFNRNFSHFLLGKITTRSIGSACFLNFAELCGGDRGEATGSAGSAGLAGGCPRIFLGIPW